jgi:hypothetical protein
MNGTPSSLTMQKVGMARNRNKMSEADDDDVSSAANAGFTTQRQLVVDASASAPREPVILKRSRLLGSCL